jgi:site-specific DNA-cytosine methylase
MTPSNHTALGRRGLMSLRVVEFFSGIGGWRCALNKISHDYEVLLALDINPIANLVYSSNYHCQPSMVTFPSPCTHSTFFSSRSFPSHSVLLPSCHSCLEKYRKFNSTIFRFFKFECLVNVSTMPTIHKK